MVAVTYTTFHLPMHLTTANDISAVDTETLIDAAINHVNALSGWGLSNMAGAPGAMTVTLTSAQWGVVFFVTRAHYYSDYKGVTGASVGGVNAVPIDIELDPQFNATVRRMIRQSTPRTFVRT